MHLLLALLLSLVLASTHAFHSTRAPVLRMPSDSKLSMMAEETEDFPLAGPIGAAGVASSFICGYSLYVLKTTSCGLPPGPFGLEGLTSIDVLDVPYIR